VPGVLLTPSAAGPACLEVLVAALA
jgi:hypothetical protein